MEHLPLFMRVEGCRTAVIGGGSVAARKAELLLKCGAHVTLISPALHASARQLIEASGGRAVQLAAEFEPSQLENLVLVIAATDSQAVNAAVAAAARARRIPVNVVDDLEASSVVLPAIVDRSPVVVAIGSQGAAPVLARRLREQLEALLPSRLGALARFAAARRRRVQSALRVGARRTFWERVFAGKVAAHVLAGEDEAADCAFADELAAARTRAPGLGEVFLIGAGPGDPDLLTLRALQLLQQADVVLYDRLVAPGVLDRARREAQRVFVGKEPHGCATSQERIHELLIEHARKGLKVARLKGGDPFVFGRGGEEIQALLAAGIPFTIVPGITAGLAAAAAAAIPLTLRELSQSVTFATGHAAEHDLLDWAALARPGQTVVFYMSVSKLADIASRLCAAGAPAERPAALIERASLPGQRVLRSALGQIAERARAEHVSAPALLIVGEVAAACADAALDAVTTLLQGAA